MQMPYMTIKQTVITNKHILQQINKHHNQTSYATNKQIINPNKHLLQQINKHHKQILYTTNKQITYKCMTNTQTFFT